MWKLFCDFLYISLGIRIAKIIPFFPILKKVRRVYLCLFTAHLKYSKSIRRKNTFSFNTLKNQCIHKLRIYHHFDRRHVSLTSKGKILCIRFGNINNCCFYDITESPRLPVTKQVHVKFSILTFILYVWSYIFHVLVIKCVINVFFVIMH